MGEIQRLLSFCVQIILIIYYYCSVEIWIHYVAQTFAVNFVGHVHK